MFDDFYDWGLLPMIFYLTLGGGIGLVVPALFGETSPTTLPANFLYTQEIIATFNSQNAQIGKLTSELDALNAGAKDKLFPVILCLSVGDDICPPHYSKGQIESEQ